MNDMNDISILIAGDYSPRERFQSALDCGTYQKLFTEIKPIVSSVDYSVINFETTIPTKESIPIDKVGCHLSAKENAFDALRYLGFKMLTMANNHIMDYGIDAMYNSLMLASVHGFDIVGAGINLADARKFKVVEIHGKRVAFINACEHESSIATETDAGCNPLDVINISYDIKYAMEVADYIIVIIHGGNEHYQLPSPRMKKTYRFFIDQGADAVLNHHQHCYSGYEKYNGKPIFYGLGNFCFDSASDCKIRYETYNYGYMVKLYLSENIRFELIPYEQCLNVPGVYLIDEKQQVEFIHNISILNSLIEDDQKLSQAFRELSKKKRDFVYRIFRPYSGQITTSLYYRGFLPSFLNKIRLKIIAATLKCESHHDVLMENLRLEQQIK